MKPLKATATTSQPVLTLQQIETIFYKIQDIYEIHKEFYDSLCPKVQQWDSNITMGHLFQKLVRAFPGALLCSPPARGAARGKFWPRGSCLASGGAGGPRGTWLTPPPPPAGQPARGVQGLCG